MKVNFAPTLKNMGNAIGEGITNAATHSAKAALQANEVSKQSQAAQGAFNQASADNANLIGAQNTQNQYAFNSAMMDSANQYNSNMWQQAANWNEAMWEKQAAYNAEQAQIQRDWSERMENTRYQRAVEDMGKAGLNPVLAVTNGISTGAGNAGAASVAGTSMSSASAQMASGGLLNGNSASESMYQGQMEYMGGMLGLISSAFDGISSAMKNFGSLGDLGQGLGKAMGELFTNYGENGHYKNEDNALKGGAKMFDDWTTKGANWLKKQFGL